MEILAWSAILKKNRACEKRPEVRDCGPAILVPRATILLASATDQSVALAKRIAALVTRMWTSQSSRSAALAKRIAALGTRMQLGILNFPVPQLSSSISIKT